MLTKDVKQLDVQERFLYWISERESIRKNKECNKPRPWTDDKILQSYRFCNVRRMDDKVSRWLLENWYKPYYNHPMMLTAVACARFFNLPESLEQITDIVFSKKWKPDKIVARLREYRDKGNKVFNGAYMVRGNDGIDKIDCVVNHYVSNLFEYETYPIDLPTDSMKESHSLIYAKYGFGSFMAGQIVADLRWAVDGAWKDRNQWAPIGPGSLRGMNVYQGRDYNKPLHQDQFSEELREVISLCKSKLPKTITTRLEAIDYQNCFCEFWKYSRTLLDVSRPKQKYSGYE